MDQNLVSDLFAVTSWDVPSTGGEDSEAGKFERFIAFYSGSGLYCVRADDVAEVIHAVPVAAIPNPPRGISGIAAFRGEVLTILSLRELSSESDAGQSEKSKMVVLQAAEDHSQFAIPSDRMHGVVMLPQTVSRSAIENGFVRHVKHDGSDYNLLDIEKLSAEISADV